MGYFEVTMHAGIIVRVNSSFKLTILALIFIATNWNFGVLLLYLHLYLFLPTRFWGFVAIPTFVFTSAN